MKNQCQKRRDKKLKNNQVGINLTAGFAKSLPQIETTSAAETAGGDDLSAFSLRLP